MDVAIDLYLQHAGRDGDPGDPCPPVFVNTLA